MEQKDNIMKALEYIEENLKNSLTNHSIANALGYSDCHFSRLFKNRMGVSVMDYVKERRFVNATKEILNGKRILDIALDYGYETHSGFTKAYRKYYGFSPTLLKLFHLQQDCIESTLCEMESGEIDINNHILNQKGVVIMCQFINQTDIHATKEVLYDILIKTIEVNQLKCNKNNVKKAYDLAIAAHEGKKRYCGDDYVTHPLNVAIILASMEADEETILAGILHDVIEENTPISISIIEDNFSSSLAAIVSESTTFLKKVKEGKKIEEFDDKVVMVRLADRLHNMRTIEFTSPDRYKERATETLELFSPIAAKIENIKLKSELDSLALKYL